MSCVQCTELPAAPRNGMVVAPNLDHGMVGKFECRDGYMLKGNNTTQVLRWGKTSPYTLLCSATSVTGQD